MPAHIFEENTDKIRVDVVAVMNRMLVFWSDNRVLTLLARKLSAFILCMVL